MQYSFSSELHISIRISEQYQGDRTLLSLVMHIVCEMDIHIRTLGSGSCGI